MSPDAQPREQSTGMLRPVFIFKILILSIVINFALVLYFLLVNSRYISRTDSSYDPYPVFEHSPTPANIRLIPMPMAVTREHSTFIISDKFHIVSNENPTNDLLLAIQRYSKYISSLTSLSIDSHQYTHSSKNQLLINCLLCASKKTKYPKLGENESYTLNITHAGLFLYASTLTGIIRGLATFVQLIERDELSSSYYVPFVNIVDRPRFSWRGLMLDVSRHWMPISVIERTLNAMELSKLNVLHMHLSDDQGFRVESIRYNLLHDRNYFYTQKDIKYIVEYARQRRIRIIPEFDIPGHTTSWFVGYPELAAAPGPYSIETRWGVMKPTMDPTKESTFTFIDNFFKEMTELFPDPYFHIGGDEVEGSQWTQSEVIQQFINQHGLVDKNGLQSYFNQRIHKMLRKYEKIMIGWEEIIDETRANLTVDTQVVIQSWKSRKALVNAISKGYRGILSHGYYLDHISSSSFHYKVDPLLNDEQWLFNSKQLSQLLGGEACMWTEFVAENTVDSRIWPRLLAIAERLWSPATMTNEDFLYERMFRMNHLLDKMGTGVTHLSSYKNQLQKLILEKNRKDDLLHPFVILADACEAGGFEQRTQTGKYSTDTPLTTFTDVLQPESELIWKLEKMPITEKIFRDTFQTWSLNHLRLRQLFFDVNMNQNRLAWGQDIELLSQNLAHVGRIGLKALDYGTKRILSNDRNDTMNLWPLLHWIGHHMNSLTQYEYQVNEVRLAAVRPVRRLLNSIQTFA